LFAGTQAENVADRNAKGRTARGERNGRAKLDQEQVATVRLLHASGGIVNRTALARQLGVTRRAIDHILNGQNWRE
jgi:DNA invertase Pin-like site-specific DNA recombinase